MYKYKYINIAEPVCSWQGINLYPNRAALSPTATFLYPLYITTEVLGLYTDYTYFGVLELRIRIY